MIKISVSFFVHLKEKAGTERIELEVPQGTTVADLKKILKERFPALGPQLFKVLVLVNRKNITLDEQILPDGADVAFLPPLSGGSDMQRILFRVSKILLSISILLGILGAVIALGLFWWQADNIRSACIEGVSVAQDTVKGTQLLLDSIDESLTILEAGLVHVQSATQNVADVLKSAEQISSDTGKVIGESMSDMVRNMQNGLQIVETSARVIDDTLGLLSAIGLVDKNPQDSNLQESVSGLSTSLEDLPDLFGQVQTNLMTSSTDLDSLQQDVADLISDLDQIQEQIGDTHQVVIEYQQKADKIAQMLGWLEKNLPVGLTIAAWVITFTLGWLILSLSALLLVQWIKIPTVEAKESNDTALPN